MLSYPDLLSITIIFVY